MRVLIMVLSSDLPVYNMLELAQKNTWDKEYMHEVPSFYYSGSNTCCSDKYNMMHWKFKVALDMVWDKIPFDFIFRTNSSTYVRKDKIYDFLKDKPREGYYTGEDGGGFVSGTGACISRDLCQILRNEITSEPTPAEDCLIGSILEKHGVKIQPGPVRLQFNFAEDKILEADYYRCKSEKYLPDGITLDRNEDIRAFKSLYKHFHG